MTDTPTPRLVLVHGTRMDGAQWEPYHRLIPEAELVAVDLPGHGPRVDEPFTAEEAVATIARAVDDRAPDQPVVVAGHSLGGYLATLYAADRPETLDALVLVGATGDPSSRLAGVYRAFARLLPHVGPERMARFTNGVMRRLGVADQAADRLPGGAAYAALPAAWNAVMDACGPDLLRDVRYPVVLVNGQWDQMRVSVRNYARACAHPHVVTIPRATHFAPLTHPEQVAAVLRRALDLVDVSRTGPASPPTMEG